MPAAVGAWHAIAREAVRCRRHGWAGPKERAPSCAYKDYRPPPQGEHRAWRGAGCCVCGQKGGAAARSDARCRMKAVPRGAPAGGWRPGMPAPAQLPGAPAAEGRGPKRDAPSRATNDSDPLPSGDDGGMVGCGCCVCCCKTQTAARGGARCRIIKGVPHGEPKEQKLQQPAAPRATSARGVARHSWRPAASHIHARGPARCRHRVLSMAGRGRARPCQQRPLDHTETHRGVVTAGHGLL